MTSEPNELLLLVPALVMALLSLPMIFRKVPPNGLYGLRVHATLADPEVWYEANARSGRDLFILSLVLSILAAAGVHVPGMTGPLYFSVGSGLLVLGILVVTVIGVRRANRILKETMVRRMKLRR